MSFAPYLLCAIPFWIPMGIGFYLVLTRPNRLSLMAGLLTLKPIVATPIWLAILANSFNSVPHRIELAHFLSVLPGASLTLAVVIVFRSLFSGPRAGIARTLLVLDCARWLNSFFMVLPFSSRGNGVFGVILALLGLTLPTVFAIVALTTSLLTRQESLS
jgi:hypothetical protein